MVMIYEIKIQLNNNRLGKKASILEVLNQMGVDLALVVETKIGVKREIALYSDNKRIADSYYKGIKAGGVKCIKVKMKFLKDKDWKSKWVRDYKPFKITNEIKVVPYTLKKSQSYIRDNDIFIQTDVVFGSGLHETTQYMAEFIRLKKNHLKSFLDIGTGTGLLSIIAKKYGSEGVSCIDIDPKAVEAAAFNFKINKVRPDYLKAMNLMQFKTKKTYAFVAANLLTQDLIEMKGKIISLVSPGKYLAVSGISLENYKKFRKEFDDSLLKCLRVKKGKQWTGVLYKRI